MNATARRVIFSLVPLVVLMGGAEIGLRVVGWPRPDGSFTHNTPYWVLDPNLHEQPFAHPETGTTFAVTTDPNGLRAPIHPVDKPPGHWRVMALGCSTTFGWGVDDAESYPARLEVLAHDAGYDQVEVINGGQPGYTTFQALWLWDRTLRAYQPDVVLLGYVIQDARKAAYTDESQAVLQQDNRYLKTHVLYRSRVYLGLRSLLGQIQVRAKERAPGEGGVYRVPPEDYAEHLRALVADVRAVGATPVMFGYPLEREGYTRVHRRILHAAAEELGVPWFDPQPQMEQASRERTLYFPQDKGHANAAGNDLIARWVLVFLKDHHLLGDAGA